eukprot:CAMPEP_0194596430 /NCGR_PEP_ID=MMETSP0292-20121207/25656_1 /TAXON_ID=39354 /ORGANISM="Heterosigma akashiwo, Strain CCMP2393" /LENGTH=114 /DNA_ID=CAMNT_0039456693 /DNA_START=230 /DNA_END=574 /DNA_ORIENTATION=-
MIIDVVQLIHFFEDVGKKSEFSIEDTGKDLVDRLTANGATIQVVHFWPLGAVVAQAHVPAGQQDGRAPGHQADHALGGVVVVRRRRLRGAPPRGAAGRSLRAVDAHRTPHPVSL